MHSAASGEQVQKLTEPTWIIIEGESDESA